MTKKLRRTQLAGYYELTAEQKQRLIECAVSRLDAFMAARDQVIFDHCRKSDGYISD